MKNIFFSLTFFVLMVSFGATYTYAQPTITLSKTIGGSKGQGIFDMIVANDGNIIALCSADSNDEVVNCTLHGKSDVWLVKMDEQGNIIWQQCYGGSDYETPYQIIQTADGGFLFVSETLSDDGDITFNHGNNDIWVVKTDSIGTMLWQISIGSAAGESPYDLIQLKNGKYILSCFTLGNNGDFPNHYGSGFTEDAWLIIITDAGIIDTAYQYGGSGDDYITTILALPNKDLELFGYTSSNDYDLSNLNGFGNWDGWVIKTDSNGIIKNQNRFGYSGPEVITSGVRLNSGNFLLAGGIGSGIWLLKTDSNENLLIDTSYQGPSISAACGYRKRLIYDGNSLFMLGANSYKWNDFTYGSLDFLALSFDSNCNLISSKLAGGTSEDNIKTNLVLSNNSVLLGGFTLSDDYDITDYHGAGDGWLVKIEGFDLVENPEAPKTQISIFPNPLHETGNVQMDFDTFYKSKYLNVYDSYGRLLQSFLIGKHNNQFSMSNYSCGLYLYQLRSKTGEILGGGNFLVQ